MAFYLHTAELQQKKLLWRRLQLMGLMLLGFVLFIMMSWIQSGKFGRLEQLHAALAQEQQKLDYLQQDVAHLEQLYTELHHGVINDESLLYLSFEQQSLIDSNQQVIWLKGE